jgi:hypothetical protein
MDWEEDTREHISNVQKILQHLNRELSLRGIAHDRSKLEPPEAEFFKKYTPLLEDVTYGSPEYEQFLEEMEPGLDHHYEHNRHHPEHFENGLAGMNLIDLVEMLADWKAASMRHEDGDLVASIEKNAERFEIDPQLVQIFKNTILVLDEAFKEE